MKRVIAGLLACSFVLIAASCGNGGQVTTGPSTPGTTQDGETQGGTTAPQGSDLKGELVFWGHQEESWNNSFRDIGAKFTAANPGVTVKFEFFPYDDFEGKMQTSLLSGQGGADVYEIWGGWALDFASTGSLAAMPASIETALRDQTYPPTLGALEYDGKLYGMPFEYNIEYGGMLVNQNILKENNLTVPKTWDEMIEGAKKATIIDGEIFTRRGFDFVNWDSVPYIFTAMILSSGAKYQNDDGTFNFASPEAKNAFTVLTDLVLKDKVTDLTGLTGGEDLEGYQQLFAGNALYVPRGSWAVAEGEQTFELTYGVDFTYEALPHYGAGDLKFAAETGWSLAVNEKSSQKDLAFAFLEFFGQDDISLQHNINTGTIPAQKDLAHSPALVEAMPYVQPLVDILDKGQFIGYFNTDIFKENINDVFVNYCQGVYTDMDAALAELENLLDTAIVKK